MFHKISIGVTDKSFHAQLLIIRCDGADEAKYIE